MVTVGDIKHILIVLYGVNKTACFLAKLNYPLISFAPCVKSDSSKKRAVSVVCSYVAVAVFN